MDEHLPDQPALPPNVAEAVTTFQVSLAQIIAAQGAMFNTFCTLSTDERTTLLVELGAQHRDADPDSTERFIGKKAFEWVIAYGGGILAGEGVEPPERKETMRLWSAAFGGTVADVKTNEV